MRTERVTYRGIVFTRYPDSPRRHHRVYFWPSKSQRDKGVGALHVEVYKAEVGPVPDGWHVHHKDEDTLNNSAGNLEALPAGEHSALHVAIDGGWGAFDLAHMDRMRELAKAWHSSPEGLAWHSEHGRETWIGRERKPAGTCTGCGTELLSFHPDRNGDRWCSRKCFMLAAYHSGKYGKEKTCPWCNLGFFSKSGKTTYCSRTCAQRARRTAEGKRVEPDGGRPA